MYVLAFLGMLFLGMLVIFAVLFFRDSMAKTAMSVSEKGRLDLQERNDRLTEALARKANVDLILPAPQRIALESSEGWFQGKPRVVQTTKETA